MRKEYLETYYYAVIRRKGFYEETKKYKSIKELEQALKSVYKYCTTFDCCYPIIEYVIYESKPIKC